MSCATMRPCGPEPVTRERSMPDSAASRRASGVTATPPDKRAGPKLRSGVRTSKNGSSLIGRSYCGACATGAADKTVDGAVAGFVVGAATGATVCAGRTPEPSAITATIAPTGATSPAGTRISASTPVVVEGTSIETLSVSISNRLSPGLTCSPVALNHLVILPSATVSPSCGIRTSMSVFLVSLDPFPQDFGRGADRAQDQPVAGEFVTAHQVAFVAGLHAAVTMVGDGAGALVDRIFAEIGDVAVERSFRFIARRFVAGPGDVAVGRDLAGHVAVGIVDDDALGVGALSLPRLAVDRRADMAPRADQALLVRLSAHLIRSHVTSMVEFGGRSTRRSPTNSYRRTRSPPSPGCKLSWR